MIIFKNKEDYDNYIAIQRNNGYDVPHYGPEKYPVAVEEYVDTDWVHARDDLKLFFFYVDDAIELINIKNQQDYLERDIFAEKAWRI